MDTHLVFLGDLVDRGPASRQVLERLESRDLPCDVHHFLFGNHEEIFLDVLDGNTEPLEKWVRYGGLQTLESYGIGRDEIFRLGFDLPRLMREKVPEDHVRFLRSFRDSLTIGDYVFVHAGIRPGISLEDQRPADLRWIRGGFLDDEATDHGFIVVHGHTITEEPDIRPNRIGLDLGCYRSGKLSALVLEGRERRFLATSSRDA
jgi:serine/threonine protein phosphatase 1